MLYVVTNFKPLVEVCFATNAKMVLINDDQCIIADIVLDVGFILKKLNRPIAHRWKDIAISYLVCF